MTLSGDRQSAGQNVLRGNSGKVEITGTEDEITWMKNVIVEQWESNSVCHEIHGDVEVLLGYRV